MNESRYGQVYSDAADAVLQLVGADADYIDSGLSYFTVNIDINFIAENHAGDAITVHSRILLGEGKKLKLAHEMRNANGDTVSTAEQFLLHVSLETRASCPPRADVLARIETLATQHAKGAS